MSGDVRANPREGRRDRAALLMAQGVGYRKVAQDLGLNEQTIRRWAAEPEIAAKVSEIRALAWEQSLGAISRVVPTAIATCVELMDRKQTPTIRLRAATTILYAAVRYAGIDQDRAPDAEGSRGQIVEWLEGLG